MKSPALILLALLVVFAIGLAPRRDQDKKVDGDLAKLQGKWTAKARSERNIPILVEIKDKKLSALVSIPDEGDITIECQISIDQKKSPNEIDWIKFTRDGKDIGLPDVKCIYELTGDEWKVCSSGPGNDRPKEFKEENDQHVMIFTRVKDKEKAK